MSQLRWLRLDYGRADRQIGRGAKPNRLSVFICVWLAAHGTSCLEAVAVLFGIVSVMLTVVRFVLCPVEPGATGASGEPV